MREGGRRGEEGGGERERGEEEARWSGLRHSRRPATGDERCDDVAGGRERDIYARVWREQRGTGQRLNPAVDFFDYGQGVRVGAAHTRFLFFQMVSRALSCVLAFRPWLGGPQRTSITEFFL